MERRAEIGLAKRTRTRAAILQAARTCYAAATPGRVTVDAVMQAAGLAKGTFYVHFLDLAALEAELAKALIEELDEHLQPARLSVDHPLTRLATAATILLRDLASAPARARLVGRVLTAVPDVPDAVQAHLREDLAQLRSAGLLGVSSVDLAARLVVALCELAACELGEERLDQTAIPDIVRAILRAIGCGPHDAASHALEAVRCAEAFSRQAAEAGGTSYLRSAP
jgi:AcrR family transcriptional regulator